MLRIKLNALSNNQITRELSGKESISTIVDTLFKDMELPPNLMEYILVVVEGHIVAPDLWDGITPLPSAEVLVAVVPKGGNFRSTARSAVIAIASIGGAVVGGMFGGPVGAAFGSLLGTVVGSLWVNQFLPVIKPGIGYGAIPIGGAENSQMYSISGQNNRANRYGFVPKVYGEHRMFPYIAANPYTELEADQNGVLSQYLYVIFDFGFGPNLITDIRIGDNPIENYTEVTTRIVDLQKPVVSEGVWDDISVPTFDLYKGDRETDSVNLPLNGNAEVGGPPSSYTIVREVPGVFDGSEQEIIVELYAPQGLYSFNTNGDRGSVTIPIKVEFAEVGTEDWNDFTDQAFVRSYRSTLGQGVNYVPISGYPTLVVDSNPAYPTRPGYLYYDIVSNITTAVYPVGYDGTGSYVYPNLFDHPPWPFAYDYDLVGYKKGRSDLYLTADMAIGTQIRIGVEPIGTIAAKTPVGGGVYKYTLSSPLSRDYPLFQAYKGVHEGTNNWFACYSTVIDKVKIHNPTAFASLRPLSYTQITEYQVTGNTQSQVFASIRFIPIDSSKAYKIRVTRLRTLSQYSFQVLSNLNVLSIASRVDRSPIVTNQRHTFLEMRIRATNQINGSLDNVSANVYSAIEVYNGSSWVRQLTSNPAWIFSDIITGPINKRALSKNRLDTASLLEWAAFCDAIPPDTPTSNYVYPRFKANFILDFPSTVQDALTRVTAMAQASLNTIDGKYGVLIDKGLHPSKYLLQEILGSLQLLEHIQISLMPLR